MENRVEKYKNWEYKINFSKDVNKFEINYPNKKLDPDTLSKYYSINECSIESIENNNFYVSQPEDFNDLFDTAYNILDFNQLYLNCILSLSPKNQEENIRHHWETHKEFFINSIKKDSYRALLARFGILCTTENKLNELMWGYYNNNEGFLLEFNYKEFPKNFHGPFPINYVKTIDKIKTNNIDHLTFLLQSNIKKDIWKHENEYRFLVESDSEYLKVRGIWEDSELDRLRIEQNISFKERIMPYSSKSIKAIYLGFNFLKGEKILDTGNPYRIEFISEKKDLKKRLLDSIITQEMNCYSIIQNVKNFELECERWDIKFINTYEYEINKIDAC